MADGSWERFVQEPAFGCCSDAMPLADMVAMADRLEALCDPDGTLPTAEKPGKKAKNVKQAGGGGDGVEHEGEGDEAGGGETPETALGESESEWARTGPGFSAGVESLFGDLKAMKAEFDATTPDELKDAKVARLGDESMVAEAEQAE